MRDKFLEDFKIERNQTQSLKGARARLEIITSRVKGHLGRNAILETNIYSEATAKKHQLRSRDTEIFEFLLHLIQPTIVCLHGKDAIQFFCPESEVADFDEFKEIFPTRFRIETPCRLFATSHLRSMSFDMAAAVGDSLATIHEQITLISDAR
jgi:hypothetical protein